MNWRRGYTERSTTLILDGTAMAIHSLGRNGKEGLAPVKPSEISEP